MKKIVVVFAVALAGLPAFAQEPDNLTLPAGFHASVVADGLTGARHLAIRDNGDIYVATQHGPNGPSVGIYALRLGPDHKPAQTEHFGTVDQGSGIRFYKGALYASSGSAVYRFAFDGDVLVPAAAPEEIVSGLAGGSHPIAFDGRGDLFVSLNGGGGANNCPDPNTPKDAKPAGLNPCPLLTDRAGIWRFDADKTGQTLADGEHYATGIRNSSTLAWRDGDALYMVMHGRDSTAKTWPELVTPAQDDAIADEMIRVTKGTDIGWPYTYYDGARKVRLKAPEYGGDGKTPVTDSKYAVPVAAFQPMRPAPLDMVFYEGRQFPSQYRGGAFIAMHGGGADKVVLPGGHAGYDIVFVPFSSNGHAGQWTVFADGFAGPSPGDKNVATAKYRPDSVAVGPDGALYVLESQKGRLWRISYGNP
ncbi:MAG TPA: PQQ-dependent sugar dehydrogenase [Rhizomicrobium sp.]|nr:PQQ-dependent sugar dehydrogenase [Rhizomicrobium sp.]